MSTLKQAMNEKSRNFWPTPAKLHGSLSPGFGSVGMHNAQHTIVNTGISSMMFKLVCVPVYAS